jgi:glycosyltransferase involved in cell wall biosynthesis
MNNNKIIVVLPAYNAAKTLKKTVDSLPEDLKADLLLVDDASTDNTLEIAKELGIESIRHEKNLGYGANQKTCYREALKRGADIVVMLHPDCQYDPRIIKTLIIPIAYGICDIVLGNRICSRKDMLRSGMPVVKYLVNRILTIIQNEVLGQNLGEFLTGYRAYSRKVLEMLNLRSFSNDFVFDSELIIAATYHDFKIGDVPVPTIYTDESSQIKFKKGIKYTLETFFALFKYIFQKLKIFKFAIFRIRKS